MGDFVVWIRFLLVLAVLMVANFVPALVAYCRGHRHATAIFALVFFAGWTGWGWVAGMIWALTPPRSS